MFFSECYTIKGFHVTLVWEKLHTVSPFCLHNDHPHYSVLWGIQPRRNLFNFSAFPKFFLTTEPVVCFVWLVWILPITLTSSLQTTLRNSLKFEELRKKLNLWRIGMHRKMCLWDKYFFFPNSINICQGDR